MCIIFPFREFYKPRRNTNKNIDSKNTIPKPCTVLAVDKIQKLRGYLLEFTYMKTKGEYSMQNTVIEYAKVPLINIPMMSDDEWNRLVYRKSIERKYHMNEIFKSA